MEDARHTQHFGKPIEVGLLDRYCRSIARVTDMNTNRPHLKIAPRCYHRFPKKRKQLSGKGWLI